MLITIYQKVHSQVLLVMSPVVKWSVVTVMVLGYTYLLFQIGMLSGHHDTIFTNTTITLVYYRKSKTGIEVAQYLLL